MIRKVFILVNKKNIVILILSLIFSIISLISIVYFDINILGTYKINDLFTTEPTKLSLIFGSIIIAILIIRTIISDLGNLLLNEKRIICQKGRYDYIKFFGNKSNELIFSGQNMMTLLTSEQFFPFIKAQIDRLSNMSSDRKNIKGITFILTTYEAAKIISKLTGEHFKESIRLLSKFYFKELNETQRKFLTIKFHLGATSLSSIIRDPNNKNRAAIVFATKWATDTEPNNRLYSMIEKWDNPDLFDKMYGHVKMMTMPEVQTLIDMCKHLNIEG